MLDAAQLWLPTLAQELGAALHAPSGTRRGRAAKPRARAAPLAAQAAPDLRASRRAFLGVVARWSLTGAEALSLLGEPMSDEPERHERLRGLLGAHRSLLLLAPDPAHCARLLREPDPTLEGACMLRVMMRDGLPGIERVRAHLLARLGG